MSEDVDQIELRADPRSTVERVHSTILLGVLAFIFGLITLASYVNGAAWYVQLLLLLSAVLSAVAAVGLFYDIGPFRDWTRIRFGREGYWGNSLRVNFWSSKLKAYDEKPAVQTLWAAYRRRVELAVTSRTETNRKQGEAPSVHRSLSPRLHRDIERLRDLVAEARDPEAFARPATPTHCLECHYLLHHPETPASAGLTTCPECGWSCGEGGIVLFGRPGPTLVRHFFTRRAGMRGKMVHFFNFADLKGVTVTIAVFIVVFGGLRPIARLSSAAIPVLVIGFLAMLFVWKLVSGSESEREREDRLAEASLVPAGREWLLLNRDGIAQGNLGQNGIRIESWNAFDRIRIQRWPGGVRVRADWHGSWRWPGRRRPVDFICDLNQPGEEVRDLRQRVRSLNRVTWNHPADEGDGRSVPA